MRGGNFCGQIGIVNRLTAFGLLLTFADFLDGFRIVAGDGEGHKISRFKLHQLIVGRRSKRSAEFY